MKKYLRFFFLNFLAIVLLSGCGKEENPPIEKEHASKYEENIVTLTEENLQHVEIETEPVRLDNLEMTLKVTGRISSNLNKTAKVNSTLQGRLVRLNFDINDHVKTNDVVGLVETPELLGKLLELKAPIDGVVIERKSTMGELVDKDKEIYVISDPTQLWVIAEIKERDISSIRTGQEASFSVLAYPDEIFHGKIVRIANQVEPESRTLEVRLEINNLDGRLKSGMFADIEITTNVLENVLVISDDALQTEGENQIVFVALNGNKFEKRVVKLGLEQQGHVQVLEGLKKDEKVVTRGSFILKSEMLKSELGEE